MSKTTKQRFVRGQLKYELVLPKENELVAQMTASCGNNLIEVVDSNGDKYLATMPVKYRNTIWVMRGNFVLLSPIEEGDKVKAEVTHILDQENILYIRDNNQWPECFETQAIAMTRSAKRGTNSNSTIDPDMLPSSESEDSEGDEENDEDYINKSDEDIDSNFAKICNPNRK